MNLSVNFTLNSEAKAKKKPVQVLVRKTGMKGKIKRSTGLKTYPKNWSKGNGRPTKGKQNARLKERLDTIRHQMEAWFQGLSDPSEASSDRITEKLEEVITGETSAGGRKSLFEHFEDFIEYKKQTKRHRKTIRKYRRTKEALMEFSPDLSFKDLNEKFYDDFTIWLVKERDLINKSANKYIEVIKAFLNYCYRRNIIKERLGLVFRFLPQIEQTVISLTEEEFSYLENLEEEDPKLQKVLDLFLFSCHTSLRYKDLQFVNEEKVKDGVLVLAAHKTKVPYMIGLSDLAMEILQKYGYSLPVLSNQNYNKYLKQLFRKHGFDRTVYLYHKRLDRTPPPEEKELWEVVSTHTGRKTWVTDKVRHGIPDDHTKAAAGFSKNSKSFQAYKDVAWEDIKKAVRNR